MPPTLLSPGVYIEELPSAVRTVTGVPTSITAFVGAAWKGPTDDPIEVSGFADFERKFGGLWRGSLMSTVQQFFSNGGSRALITRVFNRADSAGTKAATAKFSIDGGTKLEAANPGSWGNDLALDVALATDPDLPPDAGRFNLTIRDDPNVKGDARKLGGSGATETFFNVSVTPGSPRFILDVLAEQSQLLRVLGGLPANVGATAPSAAATVPVGTPGRDGSNIASADVLGMSGDSSGIFALTKADIFNLLCLPPVSSTADIDPTVWSEAAKLCADHRAVLLVDAPAARGRWTPPRAMLRRMPWPLPSRVMPRSTSRASACRIRWPRTSSRTSPRVALLPASSAGWTPTGASGRHRPASMRR